jgi:hypothetical protein
MKKRIIFLMVLHCSNLWAGFNFSHKDSSIRIGSQAQFVVNREIAGVDGTFSLLGHDASRLTGAQKIKFTKGALVNDAIGSTISATYDPSGNSGIDLITLEGSASSPHSITSEPSSVLQKISVVGQHNGIYGSPVFTYPIVFDGDPNTTLTVGLQSVLNKNIELNSGILELSNDLSIADDVMIEGAGTIKLNFNTINFPGMSSSWTDTLMFYNAQDIELHARTALTGTWTFSGEGVINGNGCILDITDKGALRVMPNSTLYLNAITVKGLGVGKGDIILEADDSKLVLAEAMIELEASYTTSIGKVYAEGETTVIVKDHAWWFDVAGSLTVDGVTLWTDKADEPAPKGLGVRFGVPESAYYSSVASGTIKMMSAGLGDFLALSDLVNSNSNAIVNTWDLTVNNSYAIVNTWDLTVANSNAIVDTDDDHLFPGDRLYYGTDTVVDGNGRHYVFSHWSQPQFVVAPGVTVELKNIEFFRINENTFSMGAGSKLKIGENVTFEIVEDVVWDKGKIEIIGDNTVFTLRGMDGTKKFTFQHICVYNDIILDLGTGTLLLENIELTGIHLFDGSTKMRDRRFRLLGAVALGGNAIVNVEYQTGMHFVVKNSNNEFRLFNNNIRFKGNLFFGNERENELHMRFFLKNSMAIPQVNFVDQFMHVSSTYGIARLIFDDALVRVYNENSRAFVVAENSFLSGRRIELLGYPIKQVSPYFELDAGTEITGVMDNVITQEFIRSPFVFGRTGPQLTTALQELDKKNEMLKEVWKSFTPGGTDLFVRNSTIKLSDASNTIKVDKGTIKDFGVSASDGLDITLENGGVLQQKNSAVTIKTGDNLRIVGEENRIVVKNQLTINGDFTISNESDVTFEFDETTENPTVYFAPTSNNIIDISKGAQLRFTGRGTVVFADGTNIRLNGSAGNKISKFVLQDSSKFTVDENAVVVLRGEGKWVIEKSAQVYIGSGRQLVLGYYPHDSMEVSVDDKGEFVIDGKLSFVHGAYSLDFLRNSNLIINNGGVCEINSLDEQASSNGLLSRFTFQEGTVFKIATGGKFLISENKHRYRGAEIPFTWNNLKSSIVTGGLVGVVGTNFIGMLQNNISAPVSVTAEGYVDLMINRMPSLSVTTLFLDENGVQKVRTKDDVIVALETGDEVSSDDATTGTISVINDGELVEITSQGERI